MSVTVASIIKNEADRFLADVLAAWSEFADRIVVLDDGSTDETPDILRNSGVEAHFEPQGMAGEEWKARRRLFELATEGSEWVIWLDADQILSSDPRPYLKAPSVAFRVFDMWSATEYRDDAWWRGHARCWWRAIHAPSYKDHAAEWSQRGWHSGHLPKNLPGTVHPTPLECSVLHYAYASPELRAQKAEMYSGLAPHLTPKERWHAKTIMTPDPQTKELPFTPEWRLM